MPPHSYQPSYLIPSGGKETPRGFTLTLTLAHCLADTPTWQIGLKCFGMDAGAAEMPREEAIVSSIDVHENKLMEDINELFQ
jgi:hypothetical protein